jgi:euchromatic histone-lysine N-methyltransferase
MADRGHHGPEAAVVKSSSEALRRSDVAAQDGPLGIGLQGVPAVLVEGRGNGAGSGGLGRKEVVPAVPLQSEPMIASTKISFPPGCGKDAVLSVLVGGGVAEMQLPLESGLTDGDLSVAEEVVVPADGCISDLHGHHMEILPPQCHVTIDGTAHDYDGLEEGEIPPDVVIQESQVFASCTQQNSSTSRHGAAETSTLQLSIEKTGGNMLQCGEKGSSYLVAKEVEVMKIGSSCNSATESLVEDSSNQNLMCNRMSESARMNRAPSAVAAGDGTTISITVHASTAYIHGASAPQFSAVEASVMQPLTEMTGGNTLQCENRQSQLVAKGVKVMNESIGSSKNIGAESLAEDSSKQDMMGRRVSESARMNTYSYFAATGESSDGTKIIRKAMFTPRKVVGPIKNLQEESELGRGVTINRMKDTGELTTDQGKAAATRIFGPRKKVKVKASTHLRMKIASTCALDSKGELKDEVASNLDDDDILKALVVHEGKLELYLNNSSGLPSVTCQRQYGSENADARSKFKILCRRFEFICRALVQAVEQHSLKIRRIDLEADKVMRKLPGFIKHGPIVGQVPGVEVGDEFLYRVQLAIVGLHRMYQGGIDTTTYRNGKRIAISIVASGGYPDELPCSGELIYTGSGGKPAGKKDHEDQKLERGNLALKNCIKTKTPVRVIHGFKGYNTEGHSHSRAKQISTFTYDGLYQVVDFWMHGRPGSRVFKYKLQKIPGQAELPIHIAKGMRKSKTRPGLCEVDISQGKEGTPICVINTVDNVRPTPFRYITRIKYPFGLTKLRHQGCDCTNGCSDSVNCACSVKNGGEIPFNLNGAIVNEKPLIFECGPSCKCPPSCQNRVSQHGMKIPLEVFRTTKTGWGVRSLSSISSGSFICEYVGELLYGKEVDKRRKSDYLFDIGLNCDDENLCNGLIPTVSGLNSSSSCAQTMEDVGFTLDAAKYGNIGRFINHSCSPNLYPQNVLWDHDDKRMTHIMFFAAETIPPLQELTYDYNYEIDQIQDANGRIKFKVCQCGSPQCSGRLY